MRHLIAFLHCLFFKFNFHNLGGLTHFFLNGIPGENQEIDLGMDLFGDLLNPSIRTTMNVIDRKQFLTITFIVALLQRMSMSNRQIFPRIMLRILNTMITPVVTSEFLQEDFGCNIHKICWRTMMRHLVLQIPQSELWENDSFQLSFLSPYAGNHVTHRILLLSHPFRSRIDPSNILFQIIDLFISWALIAKITIDTDDRRRFGRLDNPNQTVEEIYCSLTDDEIMSFLESHEVFVIVRRYIHMHIQQCAIRDVIALERISRELVCETVESAMRTKFYRMRKYKIL